LFGASQVGRESNIHNFIMQNENGGLLEKLLNNFY
jgi:hypothetical protein